MAALCSFFPRYSYAFAIMRWGSLDTPQPDASASTAITSTTVSTYLVITFILACSNRESLRNSRNDSIRHQSNSNANIPAHAARSPERVSGQCKHGERHSSTNTTNMTGPRELGLIIGSIANQCTDCTAKPDYSRNCLSKLSAST